MTPPIRQLYPVDRAPTDAERIDALEARVLRLEQQHEADQLLLSMQVEAMKQIHAWMVTTGARIDLATTVFGGAS